MSLAEKIIMLRKEKKWSQEELAEKLQVSRQAVSKWESGFSTPELDKIVQISQIFNVTTDFLIKDDSNSSKEKTNNQTDFHTEETIKVSLETVKDFLFAKKQNSILVAIATALCILSVSMFIFIITIGSQKLGLSKTTAVSIGMCFLLINVAVAVFMFIFAGNKISSFNFSSKNFTLESNAEDFVKTEQNQFRNKFFLGNALGTCLCILSVIPLILVTILIPETNTLLFITALMLLFFIVTISVVIFIIVGIKWESYEILLQSSHHFKSKKAMEDLYWSCIVVIYLIVSFVTKRWNITWIIWPIANIVFSAINLISIKSKNTK